MLPRGVELEGDENMEPFLSDTALYLYYPLVRNHCSVDGNQLPSVGYWFLLTSERSQAYEATHDGQVGDLKSNMFDERCKMSSVAMDKDCC